MNPLQVWSAVLGLSVSGAVLAQSQTQPQTTQPPSTPSTDPAEGTAADRTPPGQTSTQQTVPEGTTQDPTPSTDPAEGTAADTSPPGETATGGSARMARSSDAQMMKHRASQIIGMQVQTPAGKNVGTVRDIVIDSSGTISQVIVDREATAGGKSGLVSVPWSTAGSMIKGDALVLEQARLDQAPSVDMGSSQY